MFPVLMFPQFDPVLIHFGPFPIRWYALAYITGLLLGWQLARRLVTWGPAVATALQVDDFLSWATLGVVLGGRLGYVLFYQPEYYWSHPAAALAVWQGGMSFHGGALGVIVALILFSWKEKLNFLGFSDRIVTVVPIGLGLGRIANFINGELWGRVAPSYLPWAMIFPNAGIEPRHPSQIYQALLEGLVLFCVLFFLCRLERVRRHYGFLSGAFLIGYGILRSVGELFRQPDVFIGFLWDGITMGQILCVPMIVAGTGLIVWSFYKDRRSARKHV